MTKDYKILFITGMGRSGSTIVSILLAQSKDVINIGEIGNLWRDGFVDNLLCGCGKTYQDCEFWSAVVKEVFGGFERIPTAEMYRIWKRVYRNRQIIPCLMSGVLNRSLKDDHQTYIDIMDKLYQAITKISGKKIVIDSSKYAAHGFHLNKLSTAELYVMHWIRDSRAVAFSWQRKKLRKEVLDDEKYLVQRNLLKSIYVWNESNFWSHTLGLLGLPKITMRYEDFVSHPRNELEKITNFVGMQPLAEDSFNVSQKNFVQSHSILGNPMRFTKKLEIRPDFEWHHKFPFWKKAVVTTLTFPMLLSYDYIT